jgi:hypothetical protein
VLRECFKNNPKLTEDLLIQEIEMFSKRTVIELAIDSNSLDFMSNNAIQMLLNDIWFGKIDPETSYFKVNDILM